jgi:hypothetical protein
MSDILLGGASHPLSKAAVASLRHRQQLAKIVRSTLAGGHAEIGSHQQMERWVRRPISAKALEPG